MPERWVLERPSAPIAREGREMADRWSTIDLPMLEEVDRLSDLVSEVTTDLLEQKTHLPRIEIERSLRRLYDADYITGIDATGFGQDFDLLNIRLLERGLAAVGAWPADAYDDLVRTLEAAIGHAETPDEKSRLQRLLEGVAGAGRDIAVGVLSEWAKRQAGM
jgi:hypothetical protein